MIVCRFLKMVYSSRYMSCYFTVDSFPSTGVPRSLFEGGGGGGLPNYVGGGGGGGGG